MTETPIVETYPETRDTPHGKVYRPKSWLVQGLFLMLAFFGGPALGELTGRSLGGVSENAQIFLYLPFVAIFFLGYGLWSARLHAIAFDGIGRGVLKALFMLLIRRKKPESLKDVMPSPETLEKMAVQAQKAGWSFLVMAVPVALVAGLVALFFETEASAFTAALLVAGGCIFWGWVMGLFARRGYLPIMQDGA